MTSSFFPTRALFWTFWANTLFIIGMVGYCLMDSLDYMRRNRLGVSTTAFVYIFLAALFVVHSTFQFLSIYHVGRHTHRYYAMLFSYIFDALGSWAYLAGAVLATTTLTSGNTVWTFNATGVVGFAIAALINMMVPGTSSLSSWANLLNLLGASLYLVAMFINVAPLIVIIVLAGDYVYLLDSILYKICWFSDRQWVLAHGEQSTLLSK